MQQQYNQQQKSQSRLKLQLNTRISPKRVFSVNEFRSNKNSAAKISRKSVETVNLSFDLRQISLKKEDINLSKIELSQSVIGLPDGFKERTGGNMN